MAVALLAACGGSIDDGALPAEVDAVAIPDEADVYRITYARLLDPHVFTDPVFFDCTDVTDSAPAGADSANEDLEDSLSEDRDRDSYFDLGVLIAVTDARLFVANGHCRVDDDACIVDRRSPAVASERHVRRNTRCFQPEAESLSTAGYRPAVPDVESPCSSATFERLAFRIGDTDFTMRSATAAATDEGGRLRGMIAGFVDLDEAQAATVRRKTLESFLPGGTSNCATHDDRDEGPDGDDGWWFFVEFEAEPVRIVDAPPFVLSGGCDGGP